MKSVRFYTPTLLSYLDLFSMGGSDKAENESTIGKYNSGLKFSMALALRNNVKISINVLDETFLENFNRKTDTFYSINTYNECCEQTGKDKDLIQITKCVNLESFFSSTCNDYGGGDLPKEIINTGFSTKLGIDWELWMMLREIYSNMVDEGGFYLENDIDLSFKNGTIVELQFEDDSEFSEIWNNRHLYINEKLPLFSISSSVDALTNDENYIRIYKQNILVYENKNIPSLYAYNIKFGDIDEKRILSDVYSVKNSIGYAIKETKNEEYLKTIITKDFVVSDKDFLNSVSCYRTVSDTAHNIATEVYLKEGDVNSYGWLMKAVKERKDCVIAGKVITSVADSLWSYSTPVTVESSPQAFAEPDMVVEDVKYASVFSTEIKKIYDFELDVEVKIAKLKGRKVIADKFEKCLIIDNDFKIETDFAEFMVEYLDLTQSGNVITNLSNYICELLRKNSEI